MNKSYLCTIAEFASEQFDMVGIFLFIGHIVNILIYLRVLKNLKILTRVRMRDLRVLYSLFDTFSIYMLF